MNDDKYQRVESLINDLNEFEQETGLHFDFREWKVRDTETRENIALLGYDGEKFTVHSPRDK